MMFYDKNSTAKVFILEESFLLSQLNSLDSEQFLRALSGLEVREGFPVGFWNHDHHEDGVEGRHLKNDDPETKDIEIDDPKTRDIKNDDSENEDINMETEAKQRKIPSGPNSDISGPVNLKEEKMKKYFTFHAFIMMIFFLYLNSNEDECELGCYQNAGHQGRQVCREPFTLYKSIFP